MLNGILLAIEEINANPAHQFTLAPVIRDPQGSLDLYYEYCHDLLYRHGVRHVIGCYTSAARKAILPLIEGANALLWHSARYEGFESSNSVIYLGATPISISCRCLAGCYSNRQRRSIMSVLTMSGRGRWIALPVKPWSRRRQRWCK
jgi:hypothetical protein